MSRLRAPTQTNQKKLVSQIPVNQTNIFWYQDFVKAVKLTIIKMKLERGALKMYA